MHSVDNVLFQLALIADRKTQLEYLSTISWSMCFDNMTTRETNSNERRTHMSIRPRGITSGLDFLSIKSIQGVACNLFEVSMARSGNSSIGHIFGLLFPSRVTNASSLVYNLGISFESWLLNLCRVICTGSAERRIYRRRSLTWKRDQKLREDSWYHCQQS